MEARVAFHLHRLKLVGRALHRAGYQFRDAADLAAGRQLLSPHAVIQLANALAVSPLELTRPLSAEESREWAFYRAAATDPTHVWQAARRAWTSHGLTDKAAAELMGFKPKTLSKAKDRRFGINFAAAFSLTTLP